MEGVERYKVRLLPHNPTWKSEFDTVKRELTESWDANILDIQHVGSTAIPVICAKPILDVAVKLKTIEKMNIAVLETLGYSYCGMQNGNHNYHLFVMRGKNQISLRHIHCYDQHEKEFDLLVGFRDYLNEHNDIALQYENIKQVLAQKYSHNRKAYTAGKESFIKSIYEKL